MEEKPSELTLESMSSCNLSGGSSLTAAKWTLETNWVVSHGSLENCVTVDFLDCPFVESDMDKSARNSPLVLKRRRFDSTPCEIKICFDKEVDIREIYVRSTARVYEIYHANSPQNCNEYLCTVRCGAAERDEKLLQTSGIEYDAEEFGDLHSGEAPEDVVGVNNVSSDDEWIKIKVPKVGKIFSPDETKNGRVQSVQDLYEATAQISDADPCSSLTIRFVSLQNKSHVYVDEVYTLFNLIQLTDSKSEAMTGSLTESSLMAMLVPALLQSSRSGVSQVKEVHASGRFLKDDSMEIGLQRIDEIGHCSVRNSSVQQTVKLTDATKVAEIQQTTSSPITVKSVQSAVNVDGAGVGSTCYQVDKQVVKLQEFDKNATELPKPKEHTSYLTSEPVVVSDLLTGRIERALEHLITRVSRVEDICLRFEEKLLRPIEKIESRLQCLENQLEKLTKNSRSTEFLGCTRISAPAFSCSESSSLYAEGTDYPPSGSADFEKKKNLLDDMSNYIPDSKFHPGLVVCAPEFSCGEDEECAPEFSCGEDEEDSVDLNPLKDTSIKPRQRLSVDDALASALSGLISATNINAPDYVQTISAPASSVDEKILCDNAETYETKARGSPAAENGRRVSSESTEILSIVAPDFTVEVNDDDRHLKWASSSSATASVSENEEKDISDKIISSCALSEKIFGSAYSFEINEDESMCGGQSTSKGGFGAVLDSPRTYIVNENMGEIFGLNMAGSSIDGNINCDFVEVRELMKVDKYQICEETNLQETCITNIEDKDIAIKPVSEHESGSVLDGPEKQIVVGSSLKSDLLSISKSLPSAIVDFEYPVLDVEFTFDNHTNTMAPLEALLVGEAKSSTEVHSFHDTSNDDMNAAQINVDIMDISESTNVLRDNFLLVDLDSSNADLHSNSESIFNMSPPSILEMNLL